MGNKRITTLKRKSDFLQIKLSGRKIRLNKWLLINYTRNGLTGHRLGMTIPKKVGNAVMRNRLKRWCKECFRTTVQPNAPGVDINVVILGSDKDFFKKMEFRTFYESLSTGLQKIS